MLGRGGAGEVLLRLGEALVGAAPVADAGLDLALDPDQAGADGGEAVDAVEALAEIAEIAEGLLVEGRVLTELEEAGEEGEGVEEVALRGGEIEIAEDGTGVGDGPAGSMIEVMLDAADEAHLGQPIERDIVAQGLERTAQGAAGTGRVVALDPQIALAQMPVGGAGPAAGDGRQAIFLQQLGGGGAPAAGDVGMHQDAD